MIRIYGLLVDGPVYGLIQELCNDRYPLTEMPTWCWRAQNVEATTLNVRFRESRKTA